MVDRAQTPPNFLVMGLSVGGEVLNLQQAFKWEKDEIVKWINSVVERANEQSPSKAPKDDNKDKPTKPPNSGDNNDPPESDPPKPKNPVHKAKKLTSDEIKTINEMGNAIQALMLKGQLYLGPSDASLGPAHHFIRVLLKSYPKRFGLSEWTWVRFKFRNLYDILGAFLMVVGLFSPAATKPNFFLPVTAMYAKWCSKLGGHPDKEVPTLNSPERPGAWPTAYQCTWLDPIDPPKTGRFCLGASFEGCDFDNVVAGVGWEWGERLRDQRLEMLRTARAFDAIEYTDAEPRKPSVQKPIRKALANSRWGNCAEAYPFTAMFKAAQDAGLNWKSINGVALERSFFPVTDSYDLSVMRKYGCVWAPCDNCKYMLWKRWKVEYETMSLKWDPDENMT